MKNLFVILLLAFTGLFTASTAAGANSHPDNHSHNKGSTLRMDAPDHGNTQIRACAFEVINSSPAAHQGEEMTSLVPFTHADGAGVRCKSDFIPFGEAGNYYQKFRLFPAKKIPTAVFHQARKYWHGIGAQGNPLLPSQSKMLTA